MNRLAVHSRRQGFTLIELLVVIGIITILIALVLPAVQQARSSAVRTETTNNLHQCSLAAITFHDANGWLPYNGNTIGSGVTDSGSWAYQILPYIEQPGIFSSQTSAKMPSTWGTPVATLLDPMRPRPGYFNGSYSNIAIAKPIAAPIAAPVAFASRAAATLTATNTILALTTPASGPVTDFGINPFLNVPPTITASSTGGSPTVSGGGTLAAANNHHTLLQITDGTSNTILVGEMYCAIADYLVTAPASGGTRLPIFDGGFAATSRIGLGDTPTTWLQDGTASSSNQWGSPMSYGGLMAMADGSVHLIPYTMPLTNLLRPNDGNTVTIP